MSLKDNLPKTVKQLLGFSVVGVFNNLIFLAVYYLVIYFNTRWYLIGNILGFLVSTLNAYMMNSKFVFKAEKLNKKSLVKTYCTYIMSLGISTLLLYVLVNRLDIDASIAPIISLMITIPFNFLMNRFWVYRVKARL